jgi:hypothetical protein
MELNNLQPRDFFAYKLGPAGLSSLAQIKIAASNAKGNLDTIYAINEGSSGELSPLAVRLTCEAINIECARIIEAYNAFNLAKDRTSLFLQLSEIADRFERASVKCDSLTRQLQEQGWLIESSGRGGKEVFLRCGEVIQIVQGVATLQKHLLPIASSTALFY